MNTFHICRVSHATIATLVNVRACACCAIATFALRQVSLRQEGDVRKMAMKITLDFANGRVKGSKSHTQMSSPVAR